MELKKKAFSILAVTVLALSFAAPAPLSAQGAINDDADTSATVNEDGGFWYYLTPTTLSWGSATSEGVTTSDDWEPASQRGPSVFWNNGYAYDPDGFELRLSATDLTSGDHWIESENLSVWRSAQAYEGCVVDAPSPSLAEETFGPMVDLTTKPEVGGNEFMVETWITNNFRHSFGDGVEVTIVDADPGRGCGLGEIDFDFALFVPAGTYTGGDSAAYEGEITLSVLGEQP